MKGLQKMVVVMVVKQVKNIAVDFIKNQGADKFKKHIYNFVDRLTNKTPWDWDDKLIDPMVKRIFDSNELDNSVVEIVDGLINLLKQQVTEGILLDAGIEILVAVKDIFVTNENIPKLTVGSHSRL